MDLHLDFIAGLWAGATIFSSFRLPDRPRIYFFMLGLGETAALGAFLAQDLLLFVLFFDLMLVPFWFLIGTFGGENRIAATTKDAAVVPVAAVLSADETAYGFAVENG